MVAPEEEGEFDDFINDDYSDTSHENPANFPEFGVDDEAAFDAYSDTSVPEEPEPTEQTEATDYRIDCCPGCGIAFPPFYHSQICGACARAGRF